MRALWKEPLCWERPRNIQRLKYRVLVLQPGGWAAASSHFPITPPISRVIITRSLNFSYDPLSCMDLYTHSSMGQCFPLKHAILMIKL